jgi:ankyrin repeat protein
MIFKLVTRTCNNQNTIGLNDGLDMLDDRVEEWVHKGTSVLEESGCLLHQVVQEFFAHEVVEDSFAESRVKVIARVKLLIDHGADVNARNQHEATPLHIAARSGCLLLVKILCKGGADLEAQNMHGATPLHNACREGTCDIVTYLIENGSEIDAQTTEGDTPLHQAVRKNKTDNIEVLILAGAQTRIKNNRGDLPIKVTRLQETKDVFNKAVEEKAKKDSN